MSNEKQIGLAMLQYVQDYDETFPLVNGGDNSSLPFLDLIQPYIKSKLVAACPDAPHSQQYAYGYNVSLQHKSLASATAPANTILVAEQVQDPNGNIYGQLGMTYKYSAWVQPNGQPPIGFWGSDDGNDPRDFNDILVPASNSWVNQAGTCTQPFTDNVDPPSGGNGWASACGPGSIALRHTGGANFCWADGHVKWMRGSSVTLGMFNYAQ